MNDTIRKLISQRLYDQLDLDMVYPNSITSTSLGFAKVPVIMDSDRSTMGLCVRTCHRIDKENPRIIRIKNTLELSEFEISEAMIPEMKDNMQLLSQPYELAFDENGNLF